MVSDDLGFLLIFIVLPTVLIVSGIWMAILMRRDFAARSSVAPQPGPEVSTESTQRSRDEQWAEALEDSDRDDEEAPEDTPEPEPVLIPIAKLPEAPEVEPDGADGSEPDAVIAEIPGSPDALTGAGGLSAALLNDAARDSARPQRDAATRQNDSTQQAEAHTSGAASDRSEPSDETASGDARDGAGDTEAAEAEAEEPVQEAGFDVSGTTAPLPDAEELTGNESKAVRQAETAGLEHAEPAQAGRKRRRQPGTRLTRLTENVRRRGRSTGRRVPPIVRPSLRDEDAMEREDGS